MSNPRKIVVTGGTGFIGRNLIEALAADPANEVLATHLTRQPPPVSNVRWVRADLTDKADVARIVDGADVVIHAAAVTSGAKDTAVRPHIHVTDNAVMTALLFRECYDRGVGHVVYLSCTVMYAPSDRAVAEEDFDANIPLHPNYQGAGWTKVYGEQMCRFFAERGNTRFTALRHSNVYGPHDKFDLERSHMFGATVTKVMTAPDGGSITVWGDGSEGRDLLHVDDLIDAVVRVLDRQPGAFGLYNIGAGKAYAVREVVRRIIETSGRDLGVAFNPSKPSVKSTVFLDCERARRDLGWAPRIDLEEGIARTLAWWQAHPPSSTEAAR